MRRGVIAIAAAAALLALPSTAGATFREFYSGPVGNGANNAGVEFHAKFHNKRAFRKGKPPSKVVTFHWFNTPVASCFDSLTDNGFDMRVNDEGKFHGTFAVPQTNRTARVTGKFKRHNRKVVGTLRLKGSFNGGCTNADSGTLDWVARHGAGD